MVNTYHALCQPAGATPGAATAAKFIDFVASPQGQKIIQDYGKDKYGEGCITTRPTPSNMTSNRGLGA